MTVTASAVAPTVTDDPRAPRRRLVVSGTAVLAVDERGPSGPDVPTLVLLHGWPDSSRVWDDVADRLAADHHVVTYDVRGIRDSTPALVPRPYAIEHLADDVDAVVAAVDTGAPVHLVGHDWGGVQGWEYVGDPERTPRVATFTSVSGPCLDHLGASIRARLRRPTPRNVAGVVAQGAKSAYVTLIHLPVLAALFWRLGGAALFRTWLRRVERIPVDPQHPGPTLAQDAIRGMHQYRSNIVRRLLRPRVRRTDLPVHLVVATRDHYVTPRLADDVAAWAPALERTDLDAGHWSPRSHPDDLAAAIAGFVARHPAPTPEV